MKTLLHPLLMASLLVGSISCAGVSLRRQVEVLQNDVDRAKKQGAYKCAPRELALAQANVEFSNVELDQGSFMRAEKHVVIARENVRLAIENSVDCGKKRDTDGDGLTDDIDQCPKEAEDLDLFEDEDGCPDTDNDRDGVLDPEDKCPNSPGPRENFGCAFDDRDQDGLSDPVDSCPDDAEDFDGDRDEDGCPDIDTDGDGLDDDVDQCPKDPEDKDGFQDEDGCPDVDNDQDGILDTADDCPNDAGPLESRGCPDRDGDGIADKDDKCPDEVGVAQPENPEKHGCAKEYKLIVIKKDRIEIKQQVQFSTGKAVIRKASFGLLAEVGDAVRGSNLKTMRIEGHTDSVGSKRTNQRLSERRANAVRTHLIEMENIPPEILEAKGLGEESPIASNRTKRGRQQNRRVEFHVERQ